MEILHVFAIDLITIYYLIFTITDLYNGNGKSFTLVNFSFQGNSS